MTSTGLALDKGLPCNLDAERFVLGSIMMDDSQFIQVAGSLEPDDFILQKHRRIFKRMGGLHELGESRVKLGLASPAQIIEDYQGGLNAFLDPSKRIKGVSTGFAKLDEMTGGFHGGELIILAARPSMGKTALALNIAQHVATRLDQTLAR